MERGAAEIRQPFTNGFDGGACQAHILTDGQIRNEGGILIDGHNPGAARFRRRSERTNCALHEDLTAIGRKDARDYLYPVAFAVAVKPHQTLTSAVMHF